MNNILKLNLGSGDKPLADYRNIDCKDGYEGYPLTFSDGSVDEVRASHLLEHFPHGQVAEVIKEWARVLKPGGRLKIAVPDFDWIIKAYQNGHRDDFRLEHYLFGGQVDPDDYHKAFFNEDKLTKLLTDAGLTDVKRWESDADDCSSYYVSLNLEGRKPQTEKPYYIPTPTYGFVKEAKGVIHLGANIGQARDIYHEANLPVIWIEPIPEVFERLQERIADYPNQRAFNYLITDRDGADYDFHVSSNGGQSSSIYDFGEHTEVWPDITYSGSIKLKSLTLKTLIEDWHIDLSAYDTLVLDAQGAELLILKGLGDLIDKFNFIRCEACSFQLYAGACELKDLDEFFKSKGFERVKTWQYWDSTKPKVSQIYEADYKKKSNTPVRAKTAPIFIEDDKTGAKALLNVSAITTVPRLGFQAHAAVTEAAFRDPFIGLMRTYGAFWEAGIQNGFEDLIAQGADYIVAIDYDSIFTNADVKELLKLIVRYPEADAIAAWQPKRGGGKDAALAFINSADSAPLNVSVEAMKQTDLTSVDITVFGLTIIKVAAILKMPKPWFQNIPNEKGEWRHGKQDADSYFWRKFGAAGNKTFMANRVRIGHLQEVVLWVDDDFNFTKQELFDWYKQGRPF